MERPQIQAILERFFVSRGLLEIGLERQQTFASTLVHLGEIPGTPPVSDAAPSLFISPLEPATGNLAIRQSRAIRMRFSLGENLYEARVEFRNVVANGPQRLIQLGYPTLLRVVGRRKIQRVSVPDALRLRVTASHYSGRETQGRLQDITLQGLCIQSALLDPPFQCKDRIKTEIVVRRDEVEKIVIQGEVAWHYRVRLPEGNEFLLVDRYGLCFHTLNPQQEGKIRYLMHLLQTPPDAPARPDPEGNATEPEEPTESP